MSAVPPFVTQTSAPPPIIIQQHSPGPFWAHRWFVRLLMVALIFSLMYSARLNSEYRAYFQNGDGPTEKYHSGDKTATDKIAVLDVSGTIMPPFTGHFLKAIKHIKEDKNIKGVLLVIDSPGGLVADSDQIYRKLVDLRKTKPIYVFGTFGMIAFFVSIFSGFYAIFLKGARFFGFPRLQADFVETPLPILTIMMFAIALQFFLMGLLAEMMVRTYHESQDKAIYAVREKIGFENG